MKLRWILALCLIFLGVTINRPYLAMAQSIDANIPVTGYISGIEEDESAVSTENDGDIPNTGDETPVGFYSLVLLASSGLFLFLLLDRWYRKEGLFRKG